MSCADLIHTLLDRQAIEYETLTSPDAVSLKEDWLEQTVPINSVGRTAILQDQQGIVIAIYPADHLLNLDQLQTTLHRQLRFVDAGQYASTLIDKIKSNQTSISSDDGLQIIIDERLTNQDLIHFEAPMDCSLFRIQSLHVEKLSQDILLGGRFSEPQSSQTQSASRPRIEIRKRIAKLDRLPAMPDMPSRILALRNNPNSTIDELVEIIENDMSLSAQIIRYANSAIFNVQAPVTTLKDAIFRVLGYETVLHFSLGYALGRVFKLPQTGPLGHENFWQHSTYSAALVQQLSTAMPRSRRPNPGITYLCGLLHDIGFLVLNLFFRNEHAWLNKMIAADPQASVLELEERLLGVSHNEIGLWLMQAWEIPEEICVTVAHHHNLDYTGPHADYALLVNLSERLLKMHGMSDADSDEIPPELLRKLELEEEEVLEITDEVLQGGATFKEMATSISA